MNANANGLQIQCNEHVELSRVLENAVEIFQIAPHANSTSVHSHTSISLAIIFGFFEGIEAHTGSPTIIVENDSSISGGGLQDPAYHLPHLLSFFTGTISR